MAKLYKKSLSNNKRNSIIPVFSFAALVFVVVASYWALNETVSSILSGEKENIRTTWLNFSISENIPSEIESNDTYREANKVELNVEYKGNLYDSYEQGEEDWFFFSLPEGGEISYTIKTTDQKSKENFWNPSLRSADTPDERIMNDYIVGNCTEYKSSSFYQSAGDYYFEIESSNEYSSDPYIFTINYDSTLNMYEGSYDSNGSQGVTALTLLTKIYDDGSIEAWFNFHPHSSNPNVPSGRFKMEGEVIENISNDLVKIELWGKEWIDQPENWSMLNFTAFLNKSTGTIFCDEYGMNLIREDVINVDDLYEKAKKYEFNGHEYCLISQAVSWANAETICSELGGHLVSINSPEEQEFVQGIADENMIDNLWLGGYWDDEVWKWTDGSEFTYSNWDENKPDNYLGNEKYIKFPRADYEFETWSVHHGKWDDVALTADGMSGDVALSSFGFICEWSE